MADQKAPTCLVCGSQAEFYCRKGGASYYRSRECGLIFQDPLPSPEEMISHADEEYGSGVYKEYVDAKDLKYATFEARLPIVRGALGNGAPKVLDVGCGCGYFIDVALEHEIDAQGVEFSAEAISAASPRARPRIIQGNVNALDMGTMGRFDGVTAFDIIEHTEDPVAFLEAIAGVLKPGGALILTTPDTGHFLRSLMRSRWPMLQPLQHTFLFSRRALHRALRAAGFSTISMRRAKKVMTLDYLMGQIRIHNPGIAGVYESTSKLIPSRLRGKRFSVDIGEIMAVAALPGRPS